MDWLELLVPLLFILLPLLGRILQGKEQPPESTLPPMTPEQGEAPPPLRIPTPQGGWSAGWGELPRPAAAEEEEVEAEIAGDHDLAADEIHTAEAMSLEPVTRREAVRRALPAPVPVALDTTEVDWTAEHERFHKKYFKPAPKPPRPERLADHLRSRGEVRRAVLLAEVLGPPRALRDLEGER